jgi:hypothetical protein
LSMIVLTASCAREEPKTAARFSEDDVIGDWWADGGFLAIGYWTFEPDGNYAHWWNVKPERDYGSWHVEDDVLIRVGPDEKEWESPIVEAGEGFFAVQIEPEKTRKYTRVQPAKAEPPESTSLDCGLATEFSL